MRRKVENKYDLANIHEHATGFILNERDDRALLHKAKSPCVDEGMHTKQYVKWFYEGDEAHIIKELDVEYGEKWDFCGFCFPGQKRKRKRNAISLEELHRRFQRPD